MFNVLKSLFLKRKDNQDYYTKVRKAANEYVKDWKFIPKRLTSNEVKELASFYIWYGIVMQKEILKNDKSDYGK